MELLLVRKTFTEESTIGELLVDGAHECFTLEDRVREQKLKGQTAIPPGEYEVVITFSNRFKKRLPLLLDVPNFEGIRIHTGNKAKDTEGCILVGTAKGENVVSASKVAFDALFAKIEDAARKEKVFIKIRDEG